MHIKSKRKTSTKTVENSVKKVKQFFTPMDSGFQKICKKCKKCKKSFLQTHGAWLLGSTDFVKKKGCF